MSGSPALYINEYTNGLTGHVDITLDDGQGDTITVGKNILINETSSDANSGSWGGVYIENGYTQDPHTSSVVYLTSDQYNSEDQFIENQIFQTRQGQGTYELGTNNCVTFAQSALDAAGLTGSQDDIASYLTQPALVQTYGGLLDYFHGGAASDYSDIGEDSSGDLTGVASGSSQTSILASPAAVEGQSGFNINILGASGQSVDSGSVLQDGSLFSGSFNLTGTPIDLEGSGVNLGGSNLELTFMQSNLSLTSSATGLTLYQAPGVGNDSLTLGSSGASFTDIAGGGTGLNIYTASGVSGGKGVMGANDLTLNDYANGLAVFTGGNVSDGTVLLGTVGTSISDDSSGLTIGQLSDYVYGNTINVAQNVSGTLNVVQSPVYMQASDNMLISGGQEATYGDTDYVGVHGDYFYIHNTDSTINVYGGASTDENLGSGDSYNYYSADQYPGGDGGDGDGDGDGDGYGDGDGGDGAQPDVRRSYAGDAPSKPLTVGAVSATITGQVASNVHPVSAAAAAAAAPSTPIEGPKWRGDVVTYAFSSSSGQALSTAEQAAVEKAFGTWAQASGLVFQRVSDPSKADIAIGFASPGSLASGVLGQTTYTSSMDVANNDWFSSGASIQLAGPDQAALAAGVGGALTYAGGHAQLYQVALSEIGHALGLSDDNDPDSIMYSGGLGSANQQLDATDVADIRQLYGQVQGTGDANTYTYNPGAGSVVINQLDTAADPDNVLNFASGITPGQVTVSADPDGDVLLTLSDGGQVTLADELDSTPGQTYGVQAVDFANGTSWSYADLLAKAANTLPASTGFSADLGQLVQSIASFEAASPTIGAASLDPSGSAATRMDALSTFTASSTTMMHKAAA